MAREVEPGLVPGSILAHHFLEKTAKDMYWTLSIFPNGEETI